MGWYVVTKTIKGRRYFYRQRSWRESGRVLCESVYIGPVDERVQAKGRRLYHGSPKADVIRREGFRMMPVVVGRAFGDGIYLSTRRADAAGYGDVVEAFVPPDFKFYPVYDHHAYTIDAAELAAQGYDGVEVVQPGKATFVVFDVAKISVTQPNEAELTAVRELLALDTDLRHVCEMMHNRYSMALLEGMRAEINAELCL